MPKDTKTSYSYSTMFKFMALAFMALPTVGMPIARRGDNFMLINELNPNMPDPAYENYNPVTYHNWPVPFIGTDVNRTEVLAGDHTVGSDDDSKGSFMYDCFGFKQVDNIFQKVINDTSILSPVDFTGPECRHSFSRNWRGGYSNDISYMTLTTVVHGLPPEFCALYQQMYQDRAEHCVDKYNDASRTFWYAMGGLAGGMVLVCVGAIGKDCSSKRGPLSDVNSTVSQPLLLTFPQGALVGAQVAQVDFDATRVALH